MTIFRVLPMILTSVITGPTKAVATTQRQWALFQIISTMRGFGRDIRFDESGVFTDNGYVRSNGGRFVDIYDGNIENIPEEYRIQSPNLYVRAAIGRTERDVER